MDLRGCDKKVIIWLRCAASRSYWHWGSHIGPRAKSLRPIWLPQCQYDIEAHLGHTITCIYHYGVASGSEITPCIKTDKPLIV